MNCNSISNFQIIIEIKISLRDIMEAIKYEGEKNGTFIRKTRKITSILKRSEEQLQDELPYNAITRQLADIIDCNACM